MKFAVVLLLIFSPSLSYSDAGISVSYRSTPVIIEKNWLNSSNWPAEAAYYEGITTQRTLNMVTVNLYFDDSLKAHDKEEDDGESKWPRALRVSKGAGYIFGINFNYAAEDDLVEYYSWDAYIGKRLFLIPHLAHLYFKIGPSWARYNYDFIERELKNVSTFGAQKKHHVCTSWASNLEKSATVLTHYNTRTKLRYIKATSIIISNLNTKSAPTERFCDDDVSCRRFELCSIEKAN